MKTHFTLKPIENIEFNVLAINSHAKAYKLCWEINKNLHLSFEKTEDQIIQEDLIFSRYKHQKDNVEYNILTNRSKKGYLIPNQKSVNYFLVINNENWEKEKKQFIKKLRENKEILLVFEIDNNEYLERFIFNDKKN